MIWSCLQVMSSWCYPNMRRRGGLGGCRTANGATSPPPVWWSWARLVWCLNELSDAAAWLDGVVAAALCQKPDCTFCFLLSCYSPTVQVLRNELLETEDKGSLLIPRRNTYYGNACYRREIYDIIRAGLVQPKAKKKKNPLEDFVELHCGRCSLSPAMPCLLLFVNFYLLLSKKYLRSEFLRTVLGH